jgi:hypothetical protein
LVLIEGIQQVAMKRDESFSPSLFTSRRSPFSVMESNSCAGVREFISQANCPPSTNNKTPFT